MTEVRYEVRVWPEYTGDLMQDFFGEDAEVVVCHRRNEAIERAQQIYAETGRVAEALQIGTDGGPAEMATGVLWFPGMPK